MSRQSRGADVTIGELSLRVSGISPRDAQLLGARVAQEVAAQIAVGARPRDVGAVELRVSVKAGAGHPSPERVARDIVRAMRGTETRE